MTMTEPAEPTVQDEDVTRRIEDLSDAIWEPPLAGGFSEMREGFDEAPSDIDPPDEG